MLWLFTCLSCILMFIHSGKLLQRRCYWLLGSGNDIVLVHYLSNTQRHQASRRGLQKGNPPQVKGEKEASSQSAPVILAEPSRMEPAAQPLSPPAAQDTSLLGTESCAVGLSGPDDLVPLIPAGLSLDMLYSVTGSRPSSDGKLSGEDASRSNMAVQDLLRSWKNDNQIAELPFLQQDYWQVRHQVIMCCLCGLKKQRCLPLHLCCTAFCKSPKLKPLSCMPTASVYSICLRICD